MKPALMLIAVSIAVCALGTASTQAALPEVSGTLPAEYESSAEVAKAESEGPNPTFVMECTSEEGRGKWSSVKTGTFDHLLLGCSATFSKIKIGTCTGLPDTTSGSVLYMGTFLLAYSGKTLVPVIVLTLSPEEHVECPGSQLILVRGKACGTVTLPKSLAQTWVFNGSITHYTEATGGTEKECQLEDSVNGAAFKHMVLIDTIKIKLSKELGVSD